MKKLLPIVAILFAHFGAFAQGLLTIGPGTNIISSALGFSFLPTFDTFLGVDNGTNLINIQIDSSQFSKVGTGLGGTKRMSISSGVLLTNPVVNSGTITGDGGGLTNLNTNGIPGLNATIASLAGGSGSSLTNDPNLMRGTRNLSEITSPSTARSNLGLGTAATTSSSAYDASGTAQNATNGLASSAFFPTNTFDLAGTGAAKASSATNGLGTAAFQSATAFDAAGSATAVTNTTAIMRGARNLTDVTSAATAAKNIGAYAGSFNLGMHTNLVGWWEAKFLTANDGDQITSYPDQSPAGHNGSVAAGSQAPIYHTNRINGLPGLSYTQAASTKMTIPNFFDSTYDHAFTIFEIRHSTKTNFSQLLISSIEASGHYYSGWSSPANGYAGTHQVLIGGTAFYDAAISDPGIVQVVSFRYGTDYAELRINGIRCAYTNNPVALGCSGDLVLGSRPGFENLCWEGELACTAIFREAMSRTDVAQIEQALSDEYGCGMGKSLIVTDGASLTQGLHVGQWGSWPMQMIGLVGGTSQWDVVNCAISGQGSDNILTNQPIALLPRIPGHKTIYFNFSGDNNLFAGQPAAIAASNTFASLDAATKAGADSVAFTILPGNRGPTWETNRLFYNAIIRSNYATHAAWICDVGNDPILGNSNNFVNSTYFYSDGVHITAQSDGIIASNYAAPAVAYLTSKYAGTNTPTPGQILAWNGFAKVWTNPPSGGSITVNNNNLTNSAGTYQVATNPQFTNSVVTGSGMITNATSTDPINITGTINNYFEEFIQNLSAGTLASTDLVLGNDLSNNQDTNHILDIFINSSGYTGGIYGTNNDAGMAGGLFTTNVYVIAQATNGHVRIAVGGQYPTNTVADFTTNGVTITNNLTWTGVASGNGSGVTALNASSLSSGTVPAAQMPALTGDITTSAGAVATTLKNTGTAGTYFKTTYDAQGRETSGSNPTTVAGFGITDAVSTNGPTIFGSTMLPLAGASNSIIATNAGILLQSITNNPGITLSNFTDIGSSTASAIDVRGTWNTSATPLPFIYVSFTNSASAGTANVLEIDSSSTPMLRLNRAGTLTAALNLVAGGSITGTTLNGTGDATVTSGNIIAATAGKGLQIKGGTNAKIGTATLSSGTVTVSTTAVTANSQIFLTVKVVGGTGVGIPTIGTVTAGTSFVINSLIPGGVLTQTLDNSQISWMIVEQN